MTRYMTRSSQKKSPSHAKHEPTQLAEESGWFGFQPVSPEEKTARVRKVFHSVAPQYDLMNDLMSGGVHRLWKRRFVDMINPAPDQDILDVAGGTGDIAFLLHKLSPTSRITLCDINESMLRVGRDRAINRGFLHNFNYVVGNAECLPVPDNSQDIYTISFGLRNVTDIDAALRDAYRILKPNGRFYCLEFSHVDFKPLQKLYDLYSFSILPKLGRYVAQDEQSYQYLAESIRKFPTQNALKTRMEQAGFELCSFHNLTGGIVAIHVGHKKA